MDDINKILQNLMSSIQTDQNQANTSQSSEKPDGAEQSMTGAQQDAIQTGGTGDIDLSSILGSLTSSNSSGNNYIALLSALKPYLRPERAKAIERIQNLTSTAYSIRAMLASINAQEGIHSV